MTTQTIKDAKAAKDAALKLNGLSPQERNKALAVIAENLENRKEEIFRANEEDLEQAKKDNLPQPIIQRLKFDEHKLNDVISGINDLISEEDILGKSQWVKELAPGLILKKITTPIGVLGVIFESRPDAFIQIASLAVKSGNAILLKGGREAERTNKKLFEIINTASSETGLPDGWIKNLTTREEVNEMLDLDEYIDLIIPRGSNEFVSYIIQNTKIPVMGHADGICHTYINKDADLDKALDICVDGKKQYVSVCNATETILVDEAISEEFLPKLKERLEEEPKVEIRGDSRTRSVIDVLPATEEDFKTEYLDYIVSVKTVDDINEAIDHINTYGSNHTDTIVSENEQALNLFRQLVDSACVFTNCSTRFSDGLRFGFGAEVGISTGKLHARGPVGVDGLTTYKYVLNGSGDIVADFSNGKREFTHKILS